MLHYREDQLQQLPPLPRPLTALAVRQLSDLLVFPPLGGAGGGLSTSELATHLADTSQDREVGGEAALHALARLPVASLQLFEALIHAGHDPEAVTEKGYTVLHLAVQHGNNELVSRLLELVSPHCVNAEYNGLTAVHIAVLLNSDAFSLLAGCSKTELGLGSVSPLLTSAKLLADCSDYSQQEQHLDRLLQLQEIIRTIIDKLDQETLIHCLLQRGVRGSALSILAQLRQYELVHLITTKLPQAAAVYDMTSPAGQTPFLACIEENQRARKLKHQSGDMIAAQAVPRWLAEEEGGRQRGKRKRTVTASQEWGGYERALQCAALLLPGLSPARADDCNPACNGRTALQTLLRNIERLDKVLPVEKELVEKLLSKGADVNFTEGIVEEAPINIVTSTNFNQDIRLLFIEHLTPEVIDNQNDEGETVLHYAVVIDDEESIVNILEKGANVMLKKITQEEDLGIFETLPNRKSPSSGYHYERTPLMVALAPNSPACTIHTYFRALSRVGIQRVAERVPTEDLKEFFQGIFKYHIQFR